MNKEKLRAGKMVKNLSGEAQYESFCPSPLPPNPSLMIDESLNEEIINARVQLAKLDAVSGFIPNLDLFTTMYIRKEALLSSQIEGTQCTLDDVLNPDIDINVNLDVKDVVNYMDAIYYALNRMKELPICSRLLKETHKVLLSDTRGNDKNPGEYRNSQNWIGPSNCSIKDARYIPPNIEDMNKAMSELERYINENNQYDPLIRAALIHYQFETIHPFLDGNGRIGRMLVMLYLIENRILRVPVIYISYFLKKNQIEYYERISEVRRSGNYEQWVRFFVEAVGKAAEDSYQSIEKITALHNRNSALLPVPDSKGLNARAMFGFIEQHPIFSIKYASEELGISYNTTSKIIDSFIRMGILKKTNNNSRNRVFIYEEYLNILREGT